MADPWDAFPDAPQAAAPKAAADPWAAFPDAQPAMSAGTKAARIVGQGAQGFNDAVANTVGAPVDAAAWLARQAGIPATDPIGGSESIKKGLDYVASIPGKIGLTTEGAPVRFEPQGTAERVAHGVGSGVGNALSIAIPAGALAGAAKAGTLTQGVAGTLATAPVTQAVAGGVQGGVTEGTGNPWLGLAAGAAVPVAIAGAKRLVTPFPSSLTPQEQTIATTAQKENIPLTPAQETGSPSLRIVEEKMAKLPGSAGPVSQMFGEQHQAFNKAALERAGVTATDASPATLDAAFTRAGQTFDDLASRTSLNVDKQFVQDVGKVATDYGRRLPTDVARVFNSYVEDLMPSMQAAAQGQNPQIIPGELYSTIRSDIGKRVRSSWKNPDLQDALRGLQTALDGAVERSTSGPLRTEWQDARRQYQALMTVDQAMRGGTQAARSAGDIPYSGLTNAVRNSDRAGFARGRGQLNALSRVGDYIAQRTPDSGTPAGEAILNPIKWPMLAGLNVAGRAYTSAPVRNYLTNQVASGPSNVREFLAAQALRQGLEEARGGQNALSRRGAR